MAFKETLGNPIIYLFGLVIVILFYFVYKFLTTQSKSSSIEKKEGHEPVVDKDVIHLIHRAQFENNRTNRDMPYLSIGAYRGIIQKFDGEVYLSNANVLHVWDKGTDEKKITEHIEAYVKDKKHIETERKEILKYLANHHIESKEKFPAKYHVEYMESELDSQMNTEDVAIKLCIGSRKDPPTYIVYNLGECVESSDAPHMLGRYLDESVKSHEIEFKVQEREK